MAVQKRKVLEKKLFELVQSQNGFFTAKQAKEIGYDPRNFYYYVNHGYWGKPDRGIYKLTNYPISENGQYTLWSLWSCNKTGIPQGTYSHLTALDFYGLTDVLSPKLHMTVPRHFKSSKAVPEILILHKKNLLPKDIQYFEGFGVTTPKRTLLDLAEEEIIERHHLADSIERALDKGYIIREFITENDCFDFIIPYLKGL